MKVCACAAHNLVVYGYCTGVFLPVCLECYRWLPHPLLSFLVSYVRHFSSLDSVVTQTHEGFLQAFKVQSYKPLSPYQYKQFSESAADPLGAAPARLDEQWM
jgi:hypothetical protein